LNPLLEEAVKGGFGFFKEKDGTSRSHHPHQQGKHSLSQPFKVFSMYRYFSKF